MGRTFLLGFGSGRKGAKEVDNMAEGIRGDRDGERQWVAVKIVIDEKLTWR